MADRGVARIDGLVLFLDVHWLPLPGAGRALAQFPFMAEQHLEEAHVERRGMGGPCAFEARRYRVARKAVLVRVRPAEALFLDIGAFRVRAEQSGIAIAMRLADRVAARRQRGGFLVVHGHAGEGFAHLISGLLRVGFPAHAFGVHIDEAHLHGGERVCERACILVALVAFAPEPLLLRAPIGVLFRVPYVLAAKGEAKGFQPHGFIGDGARKDDEVGPAHFVAVFLLERPEQAPRLVEAHIVGPGVQRREALVGGAAAAASVCEAVGARRVPGHADHQAAIMAPVGRPPGLAVRHQRVKVFLQRRDIELLQFFAIVKILAERVRLGVVLVKNVEIEGVRPPFHVGGACGGAGGAPMHNGAFAACCRVHVPVS